MREGLLEWTHLFPWFPQGQGTIVASLNHLRPHHSDRTSKQEKTLPDAQHKQTVSREQTQQAFSLFLINRQDQLLGIATRLLRNREDAMDVLQEVALKCYTHWYELDTSQNVDGWLYRVTINECYRWLRKKPKTPNERELEALETLEAEGPQQEGHLRTKQFQHFLAGALEGLSEQERMAFVLRDVEQHAGKEIAQVMGCQPATARGYYFSARKKLAKHIQKEAPEWLSLLGKGGTA